MNKSIAQVSELFRSMTPGARITAGLLLAVVVVSLGYLFRQGTAGPDAFLFGGQPLSDGELTRIEAALGQAKLTGYAREGNRLRVPAGRQSEYMAAVADAGALPPNFNTILENALDKSPPWESGEATRQRMKIAKQRMLSEIVRAMHWVDDAVVLFDERETRGSRSPGATMQVTGSVSVKPKLGEVLDLRRQKMLQKLLSHAVLGLKLEDVAVTNLGDGGSFDGNGEITPEIFEDEYYQTKIAFEMQKRESILNALRDIPGVRVEVNAELDDTVEEVTRTAKPDPKTAPRREVETTESSIQSTGKAGGQPGPIAQGPNRQGAVESPQQNQNETKSSTTETDSVVGMEESKVLRKGYTPKEIWATVTIPASYIESIWRNRNPDANAPPKPQDLKQVEDIVVPKIEDIVDPLLRLQANKGQDTYKYVTVQVLDSLPAPAIEPPSMATNALAWAGRYWSTLAMLGVAMFSLLVLRSVVRGSSPGDAGGTAAAAAPALTLHADEPTSRGETDEEAEEDRPRLRLKKGISLRDDLIDIVREDPDAAADILRSWIAKAG